LSIEVKQLSACPEHLEAVGTWIYEHWWRKPDNTPEVVLSRLRQHTQRDAVPFTIVALENSQPVGRPNDPRIAYRVTGPLGDCVGCPGFSRSDGSKPAEAGTPNEGQPVGSCCVIENDCVHRPQYAPWVAAVFVKPEWRHRGIASRLLQEACRVARRAGVKGLYIDCHVNTVPLYEKNGWTILEREVGDAVSVVMLRTLEG